MGDKRGQGISMEFIIIAAIALIVLIVIILFFTGGLQKIFSGQTEVIGTVSDQQKEIWRSECSLYCSLGQKENYQQKIFKGSDQVDYDCKVKLGVTCGDCTGTAPGCAQQKTSDNCKTPCVWTSW